MQTTNVKRLSRSEVPVQMTWNLRDLFPTRQDWENEMLHVQKELAVLSTYRGLLDKSEDIVFDALEDEEKLTERITRLSTYASLRHSADATDPINQGDYSIVASLLAKFRSELAFIDSELLSLPDATIKAYIRNPRFKKYQKYFSDLMEQRSHMLSPETEKALAALGEVTGAPYAIYQTSKSTDMQFSPIHDDNGQELPVSFALYEDRYELSADRDIRKKAYRSFIDTLQQYKNTYAATYAAEVKKQVALAKLRNYGSVTEMLLHPQQVSEQMYHNQLDIIQKELAPIMRKFARLKKRELGLDDMRIYDLKAPLDPDFNPATTYEDATATILEALSVMGPEYSECMKTALSERWVDLADNIGKSTGAFCSSPYGVHPYILITWTNAMRSAFVLAHELGHAGHFYFAGKHQALINTRPSLYTIEAPSTMNELLLGDYLLANAKDNRMKRWVIVQLLGTYYHNFVTHLLEAEFQRRVYYEAEAGKPLTANLFCEIKRNVMADFWGDEVILDEGAALTWMRQPHYYMGLYPYTYSAGLTVSTAAAQMIKEEGQPAIDRWLEMLKAGGTLKPLDLLKLSGVDMSTPEAINKAVAYVGSLVDQLEDSYQ